MSTKPAAIFVWVFIMVMCVSVISMPISASDAGGTVDAVAGARGDFDSSRGGSSSDGSKIVVSAGKGGVVTTSVSSAAAGNSVAINISPSSNYATASVFVITSGGDECAVSLENSNYSFIMPDDSVVVDVTFQLKRAS